MQEPSDIDVFTNSDNDQPITCPKCGKRTEGRTIASDEVEIIAELHVCEPCNYHFVMRYDEE